eukprot:SAG11_NODE_33787_length_275_cov_0.875000_1_plen_31_part_10
MIPQVLNLGSILRILCGGIWLNVGVAPKWPP